jgi:transcriptional regulator GlxA family with amidase domain
MGRPLHSFVKTERLDRARALLETTFLSVKQIADTVGAGDVSHFVRDFKKTFAMTPTEYRRVRMCSRQIGQQTVKTANDSPLSDAAG